MRPNKKEDLRKYLYTLDGKGVPFSYIKKVYEGNYIPPITPELVEKLYGKVYREWQLKQLERLSITTS